MADKIKLVNPQKFDVGVRTQDRPMGMNIKAGSFVLVSTDDVSYISSISNIIQRGLLRIENLSGDTNDTAHEVEMSIGIDPEHDPHFSDDEDIRKHLASTPKKIGEWLDTITEPFVLDRVNDVAMSMDNLTAPKLKVLKAKMPERDFIGE